MELLLENLKSHNPVASRIAALKALTKLLLHEVESLAEISPSKNLQLADLDINLPEKVQRFESNLICNALISVNGNQSKAAKILGVKSTTLHAKIKRYEIDTFGLISKFSPDVAFDEEF